MHVRFRSLSINFGDLTLCNLDSTSKSNRPRPVIDWVKSQQLKSKLENNKVIIPT